jgi:hypothetical protein
MEKWSPENHEKWKAAAQEEVATLFMILKRKSLKWSNMESDYSDQKTNWQVLDEAILGRLKNLRSKHKCPESLLYLGYAMEQFKRTRESQGQLVQGGKIDLDVQTVYDRMMEDILLKSMFLAAKNRQERVYLYCSTEMPCVLELEKKLGVAHDATFGEKTRRFGSALQYRGLMG